MKLILYVILSEVENSPSQRTPLETLGDSSSTLVPRYAQNDVHLYSCNINIRNF